MKQTIWLTIALIFLSGNLHGSDDTVLVKIADKNISLGEFRRVYEKNKKLDILGTTKSVDDYMQLFINYKLKVAEAESQGLDTLESFKKEYSNYSNKLAEPYLLDQSVDKAVVHEAYDRLQWDIRSSHILINLKPSASARDTAAAYAKLLRIRQRILAGEDFSKIAMATSDDPSAKENGGDIGYSTAFSTVYPYENALFQTEVGEVSPIFRTKYGYHLLKVTDKRPSRGQAKGAHIMIAVQRQGSNQQLWDSAKETIDSIYNKILSGEDFGSLAARFSMDSHSAQNNGVMDWIDNGMPLPPVFKDSLFGLSDIGQISKPFASPYGYHIIKLLDKRSFKPFEEMEKELRNEIAKDPLRSNLSKYALVDKLKQDYNFKLNNTAVLNFTAKIDNNIILRHWVKPSTDSVRFDEVLFTFANVSIDGESFARWLEMNQKKVERSNDISIFINKALDFYIADRLMAHEKALLPSKNVAYSDLLDEYYDGMLLFEISNRLVWAKANSDSVGLAAFYELNKSRYMWGERMDAELYYCKDASIAAATKKLIIKADKKGFDTDYILEKINAKDPEALKIDKKRYSHGENSTADNLIWTKGVIADMSETMFLRVKAIRQPEVKLLNECRGAVVADYQKQLEQNWVKELRSKYSVTVDELLLKTIK